MDARRLVLLAEAKVPVAFLEKDAVAKLEEVLKKAKQELSGKEFKIAKEYAMNLPKITPPDVRGKRWSYYKAMDLINEYWRMVVERAENDPELKKELENLLGEAVETMRFNNYEIHYALSMRTPPENLRSMRVILVLLLLKIGVKRGDIGKTGRGEVITEIANFYLGKVKRIDWKSIEEMLKKILL